MKKETSMAAAMVALLSIICSSIMAQVATPELPAGSYQVNFFDLRTEKSGNAAAFIATLGAAPGIEAKAAKGGAGRSWRAIPPGVAPDKWITLAEMQSGRQHDFLGFCFADAEGTVAFATRRPSRERTEPPMYPYTVAPGVWQLPMNAIREPATDILYRFKEDNIRPRPLLRIVVGGEAAGKLAIEEGVVRVGVGATEAMAFAAAYGAGWRPTAAASAPQTLHIAMAEVRQLTFDVTCGFADGKPGVVRENIPREALYDHLVAIFFRLRDPQAVVDAMPYGAAAADAIGWAEGRLLISNDKNSLKIAQPTSGKPSQAVGGAATSKTTFTARRDERGLLRFYSFDSGIAFVNPASAALVPLLKGDDKIGLKSAVAPDGRVAVVKEKALVIYQDGKELWQWPGAAGVPVWQGDMVAVSGADEVVHVLDSANRREVCQIAASPGERAMAICGQALLLYDSTAATAFDLRQGKQLWQVATGDKLIAKPMALGDNIFLAIAPGVLKIINGQSGAVVATRNWPTWIIAARVINNDKRELLACIDLRHRLTQLNPKTLATTAEIYLPHKLKPILEYGDAVPDGWAPVAQEDDAAEPGLSILRDIHAPTTRTVPAWLAVDENGTVYALATVATP